MKIYIQWATNPASDWVMYDHRDWPDLPYKPVPKGGEVIDEKQGWILRLNVQGVIFSEDHIAMKEKDGKLLVQSYNDDTIDELGNEIKSGSLAAVDFYFDTVAPDAAIGGRLILVKREPYIKGIHSKDSFIPMSHS
jgi:hypothetical protein